MAVLSRGSERECRRATAQSSGYRSEVFASPPYSRRGLRAHGQAQGSRCGKRESLVTLRRPRAGGFDRRRFHEIRLQGRAAKLAGRADGTVQAQLRLIQQHRRVIYAHGRKAKGLRVAREGLRGARQRLGFVWRRNKVFENPGRYTSQGK